MKKKLNTKSIKNELEGSVFFPTRTSEPAKTEQLTVPVPSLPETPKPNELGETSEVSRHHDTMVDTMIPSNHDTVIPENEDELLEAIRKSVKQIGKEAATQRLTLEEKNTLRTIKFTYEQLGIMTSGNEIIRIGMLFILKDYQKNGENSILAKVLKRLNS